MIRPLLGIVTVAGLIAACAACAGAPRAPRAAGAAGAATRPTVPARPGRLAGGEEVEDAETVHAVAPRAAISVVLIKPSALSSAAAFTAAITAFLRLGATRGSVLSISASIGEHYVTPAEAASMDAALRADQDNDVTVVAASGDKGAASDLHLGSTTPVKEVSLPASDPLALAVGGTSLTADRGHRRLHQRNRVEHPSRPADVRRRVLRLRRRVQPAFPADPPPSPLPCDRSRYFRFEIFTSEMNILTRKHIRA